MKQMKVFLLILLAVSWFAIPAQSLEEQLQGMGFDSIRPFEINREGYIGAWELFLKQPLDHNEPDGAQFLHRVVLRHRGFDKPVVLVTEGYAAHYALARRYDDELASQLDANLLVAEHRYFGRSQPDSLAWEHLNLFNVANDLHRVASLFKALYPGSWLSTGISKGGQTSIYYRYFFPDDVQASVAIVAPLNFSDEDERVYHFLDTVGTDYCRERIMQIQRRLLAEQEVFRPMFADSAAARNLTFNKVGGVERAFEFNVFEFSFAYWQWYPLPCDSLPAADAPVEDIFNAFIAAAGYRFFADQDIKVYQPFFYQALTEMGMYNYTTTGFEDLLQYVHKPNFHHTLPEGTNANYNAALSIAVDEWLKAQGNNMLYIYGAYDAWSATAVQPGSETNALKLLLPGGSHTVRLRHFPEDQQQMAIQLLREWLGLDTIE